MVLAFEEALSLFAEEDDPWRDAADFAAAFAGFGGFSPALFCDDADFPAGFTFLGDISICLL
jgi:hypothetical protein